MYIGCATAATDIFLDCVGAEFIGDALDAVIMKPQPAKDAANERW